MTTLNRYLKLKQTLEELDRKAAKAEGALEECLNQLKDTYECADIEEAEELLEELRQETAQAEEVFEEALKQFEQRYGDFLSSR